MPISLSAVFTSVVTFWQNCAVNIDIPEIQMPEWLKSIFGAIFYFFTYLVSLVPNFPTFDTRATLVITSVGVPFLLDILTVWFVNPIYTTIAHIADLTASFFTAYFGLDLAFHGKSVLPIFVLVVCLVWLIGRLIYILRNKKDELKINAVGQQLDKCFLDGILPGKEEDMTLEDINKNLGEYATAAQIIPEVSPPYVTVILIFLGILLFVFSYIALGIIDIGLDIPGTIRLFLPYICLPLSIICLALAVLKSSNCGARILLRIEQFIKRWGLRLLMLLLETLYIPILKSIFENLIPTKFQCKAGYEPHVNVSTSDFALFEKKEFGCIPNKTAVPKVEYRLYYDNALLYVKDVLIVNGGTILFAFVFIMLGIPYLWRKLIKSNRKFVFSINVYGKTLEKKWDNIANRLETTGIFLFQKYKMDFPNWSIMLLLAKFILMIIDMLGVKFTTKFTIVLPIYYIAMFAITFKYKPYLFPANNYLDEILYGLNLVYAIFPILASFDINIPPSIITYTSLAILVIPVASCIIFLFCGGNLDDNPTILTEEMREYIQNTREDLKEANKKKEIQDEDIFDKFMSEMKSDDDEEDSYESLEDDDNWHGSGKLREIAFIDEGDIDSIEDVNNGQKSDKFTIPRLILARKFTKMYEVADVIVDAVTINELMSYLNKTVLVAAFAIGWYVKALVETSSY